MQRGYTILDHPADLGIEARGTTLKEAFEQAAVALMSIILDLESVECIGERRIELAATDKDHLLVKWLTEILYLYDGMQFAGCRFTIDELTSTSLQATVCGETLSTQKHRTRLDVKAITYHQLSIVNSDSGAILRVYLDI
jgi:SHS2 domain-containing protein